MADQFISEIRIFAGNFAPAGWAFCSGQLLPISQNTALFSLLGTNYGGNGTTNFGLPNLQGSVPLGAGQGPGLSRRDLGAVGGEQNVTLLESQMPAHSHTARASTSGGTDSPRCRLGGIEAGQDATGGLCRERAQQCADEPAGTRASRRKSPPQ